MKDSLREVKMMIEQTKLDEAHLRTWLKRNSSINDVVKLPGDASSRHYYRVFIKDQSFIVMKMESFQDLGKNLPFLGIQSYLKERKIGVPEVYDTDPKAGYVLLEDLGDITILRRLQTVSTSELEKNLYRKCIDLLIEFQVRTKDRREAFPWFQQRFDHTKLMWEIDFTIEHFYQQYLNRKFRPSDLQAMRDSLSEICTILANEPTVLTHRDFHSRNIMVSDSRMVMIDFQDARLGPSQYDLASLLKDSYYQLDDSQVQSLVEYYNSQYDQVAGSETNRGHFHYIFDLMSIQRNFKAIGSFASFLNLRSNAQYLKYIGNTFENIRRTLLKYPKYSKLRETLFHYYYF